MLTATVLAIVTAFILIIAWRDEAADQHAQRQTEESNRRERLRHEQRRRTTTARRFR